MLVTVPRVGRSCEHYPNIFNLHLLHALHSARITFFFHSFSFQGLGFEGSGFQFFFFVFGFRDYVPGSAPAASYDEKAAETMRALCL